MYLRFTILKTDEDSKGPQGVFIAAYRLLESGDLSMAEWKHLRKILDWYEANLPLPPKNFEASRATFWFRANAAENIRRIWELVAILRAHDIPVSVHKCRRLANISYRDELQLQLILHRMTPRCRCSSSLIVASRTIGEVHSACL
jgi:hypothetical protein